jgi:hypothetical protein
MNTIRSIALACLATLMLSPLYAAAQPDKVKNVENGKHVDSKKGYQDVFCEKFKLCQDGFDVETLLEEMEKSPYPSSFNEFLTSPVCLSQTKDQVKVPMLFNTAWDVSRSEEFPEVIHDYLVDEKNDPATWLKMINTQTSDGYTFLDYMQYNIAHNHYSSKASMDVALRVVDYLCKHGGEYAHYRDTVHCP